jgi:hypothetical protein
MFVLLSAVAICMFAGAVWSAHSRPLVQPHHANPGNPAAAQTTTDASNLDLNANANTNANLADLSATNPSDLTAPASDPASADPSVSTSSTSTSSGAFSTHADERRSVEHHLDHLDRMENEKEKEKEVKLHQEELKRLEESLSHSASSSSSSSPSSASPSTHVDKAFEHAIQHESERAAHSIEAQDVATFNQLSSQLQQQQQEQSSQSSSSSSSSFASLHLNLNGTSKKVILIRHAEKPDDPSNNDLSPQGFERANCIAPFFADPSAFGIEALYACHPTDQYPSKRPIETVTPLAERMQLKIDTRYARMNTGLHDSMHWVACVVSIASPHSHLAHSCVSCLAISFDEDQQVDLVNTILSSPYTTVLVCWYFCDCRFTSMFIYLLAPLIQSLTHAIFALIPPCVCIQSALHLSNGK